MSIRDRVLPGGLAAVLTFGLIAPIPPAHAADIEAREVADGIHLFQGAGANVIALADGGDLLVIDGGLDANSADLLDAIEAETGGDTIKTLINTHWHPEQVGLNDEAGAAEATIVAHEQTHMYLGNRMTSPLFDGRFGPLDAPARPNEVSRTGGELTFGGRTVEYGYLPAAHTNGDLYVYFPEENVLAAGGAVGSDSWPLIDYWNGAFIGGLLQAYEALSTIVNDDTVIIPAEGEPMTGAGLKRQRDMYAQLFRDMQYLLNQGMGFNDVVMLNPLEGYEAEFGDPSEFLDGAYRSLQMTNVPD